MVKENVRGKDVYIIQPTCMPVNENLVELLLMVRRLFLVHSLCADYPIDAITSFSRA